jgi:hypothetical protein
MTKVLKSANMVVISDLKPLMCCLMTAGMLQIVSEYREQTASVSEIWTVRQAKQEEVGVDFLREETQEGGESLSIVTATWQGAGRMP